MTTQPREARQSKIPNLKSQIFVIVGLLLVALVVGREVYTRLILPAPPLNFDEAAHSLPGYYILRDVLRLDARAFWGDTHIQTLWPPGFSYLQAPMLALLGLSDPAARLFAYIALVLGLLMNIALMCAIRPQGVALAAWITGLITLSAPGWLSVGGLALQETPVALVAAVVFWCFLRALRTQKPGWFALTGAALFFLFLTKYNYAAFALAAIGLVDVGERVRLALRANGGGLRRLFSMHSLFTFAALYTPLILGLAFWFFGGTDIVPREVKWRDFSFFVTNENSGYPLWSEQNLLYYVRTSMSWLMPHPLLALAALLGAGWAVARIRHPGVTLLALFFVVGFVLATLHPLKAERYVAPLFPSLWMLTGLGAADALRVSQRRLTLRPRLQRAAPLLVAALAAVVALLSLVGNIAAGRLQPVWAGGIAAGLRAASDQIVAWQQPERPVLIIGTFGELSPPLFEWRLRPQAWRTPTIFANGAIQYDAPPGEGSDIERVQHWLQANPGTQVTVIQVNPDTALYHTGDMQNKNAGRQMLAAQFAAQVDSMPGYTRVQRVAYDDAGLVISYYLPQ
jgi:4-amino-4-deoxy-L-arabinose transferase-like glycosyltransferase